MKIYLTAFISLLVITSCNSSKSKEETKQETTNDTVTSVPPVLVADTQVVPADTVVPTGNGWQHIGDLSLGMKASALTELIGKPTSRSKAEEWGADGLMHQDWVYKTKGITLNISSDKSSTGPEVFSITLTSPSTYKTKKNIGIGSTYQEVRDAYSKDIDPTATDKTTITVGSVYGGLFLILRMIRWRRYLLGLLLNKAFSIPLFYYLLFILTVFTFLS